MLISKAKFFDPRELDRKDYDDLLAERSNELASVGKGFMVMVHRNYPGEHVIREDDEGFPICWCRCIYVTPRDIFGIDDFCLQPKYDA